MAILYKHSRYDPNREMPWRFWDNVLVGDLCWPWTGVRQPNGYAIINIDGKVSGVHRVAWELWNGPIPNGLVIDHLCHNADLTCSAGSECPHRICVRPDHLEAITIAENNRRKAARITHCPKGHPHVEENRYRRADGYTDCWECRRIYDRTHP